MTKKTLLIAIAFILVPTFVFAAQIEGIVQGYHCVTQGKVCPIGKEDPVAALERVFVVLTDKNDFYFVPNVDRVVMARNLTQKVRVTGEKNAMFKSITADKIQVFKKGSWKTTWSIEWQKDMRRVLEFDPGM